MAFQETLHRLQGARSVPESHVLHPRYERQFGPRGELGVYLRLFREHLNAIRRAAPDGTTRVYCYAYMPLWMMKYVFVRAPAKALLGGPYRFMRSTGAPSVARLLARTGLW